VKPWNGATTRAISSSVASSAPFAGVFTAVRDNHTVHLRGGVNRPAGSSTSFVAVAVLPSAYRPKELVLTSGLRIGLAGAFFQVQVAVDGTLSIRMSADDSAVMYLTGICWEAP